MMITIAKGAASVVHFLARLLALLSLFGMAYVMLMVVYDVAMRNLGRPGVTGLVEYVEIGLMLAVFFALAEAERRRAHVSVDVLTGRLKGKAYMIVRISGGVAAAVVAILLAWASWTVLADSIARGEYKLGVVSLPMWPARAAVFAGFLVLALEQVVTAVEDIINRGQPEEEDPELLSHGI